MSLGFSWTQMVVKVLVAQYQVFVFWGNGSKVGALYLVSSNHFPSAASC